MNYKDQISKIVEYIQSGEKDNSLKLGVEFEHFIIDNETHRTISYYDINGVEDTLKQLESLGWQGKYEGEYILGLEKDNNTITLEPGSQFELSIGAAENISDIEIEYKKFLADIVPILNKKNQSIVATSYHPKTKIEEIKLLPKKRYDIMFNYFKTRGSHAHNMMKGTAALQISIDYTSESDYRKKYRVANGISPILSALFDNGFYFEGDKWGKYNLRTHIWSNCDNNRSGIVPKSLDNNFKYEDYAEFILNRPPIFTIVDEEVVPTLDKNVKDVLNENSTIKELEHLLTMFFPDVRTKKYMEIRMMDSIPYPLNLSAVALIKGIFYNEEALDKVYKFIESMNIEDVNKVKLDTIENGLNAKYKDKDMIQLGSWLVELSKESLKEEAKYLSPLEELLKEGKNPYEKTKELGIEWCILNNIMEG